MNPTSLNYLESSDVFNNRAKQGTVELTSSNADYDLGEALGGIGILVNLYLLG